jgi:hypothetical protein
MGLHTGEPAVGSEGYLGLDVVRAARLCTVGKGGHVLLSDTTRALVGGSLPEGVAIFPLGERRLKDIDEPERVYELEIEGATPPDEPVERDPAPQVPAPPAPPVPTEPLGFGERLSAKIEETVRRSVERSLERTASQVDALVERASERPERIAERLDEEA